MWHNKNDALTAIAQSVQASSYHMRRAQAMGFTFEDVEVWNVDHGYELRGKFLCVCGTPEQFRFHVDEIHYMNMPLDRFASHCLDAGKHLYRFGSFSEKHLKEDGYSDEAVADMMQKAKDFDAEYFGRKYSGPGGKFSKL